MLNSAEHEICLANKFQITNNSKYVLLNIAEHEYFSANKYENAKSREIFMLSWVEHEKSFVTSGPGCQSRRCPPSLITKIKFYFHVYCYIALITLESLYAGRTLTLYYTTFNRKGLLTAPKPLLFCRASLFERRWFQVRRLFVIFCYSFFIFVPGGSLPFEIMAFSGYLYLHFDINKID